jgi:hypothetical protein
LILALVFFFAIFTSTMVLGLLPFIPSQFGITISVASLFFAIIAYVRYAISGSLKQKRKNEGECGRTLAGPSSATQVSVELSSTAQH